MAQDVNLPLRIHPEAEAEFAEAIGWYGRRGGIDLAVDFATASEEGITAVVAHPLRYPVIHGEARRYVVRRFPYGIFYVPKPDEIQVRAIYHLSRHPSGWQARS